MDAPDAADLAALARHRQGTADREDRARLEALGWLDAAGEPTAEAVRQEAVLRRLLARVLRRGP